MSFFPTRRARKANNVRVFDLFLQKRHMIETACLVHVVVVVAAAAAVVVVVVDEDVAVDDVVVSLFFPKLY